MNAIPEDVHLLPQEVMVEWLDYGKENEQPNPSKKLKLEMVSILFMLRLYQKSKWMLMPAIRW